MPKIRRVSSSIVVNINPITLKAAGLEEGDNVVVSVDAKKRIIITKAV